MPTNHSGPRDAGTPIKSAAPLSLSGPHSPTVPPSTRTRTLTRTRAAASWSDEMESAARAIHSADQSWLSSRLCKPKPPPGGYASLLFLLLPPASASPTRSRCTGWLAFERRGGRWWRNRRQWRGLEFSPTSSTATCTSTTRRGSGECPAPGSRFRSSIRPRGSRSSRFKEEVNKVVQAAQKAWARTPLWKRAELLHRAAAILKEQKRPFADCLVKEIAKPAKDAVNEIPLVVVLAIPPFNYPVNLAVSKIGPALIAGNALVLKPPPSCGGTAHDPLLSPSRISQSPHKLCHRQRIRDWRFSDNASWVNCISFTDGDTGIAISKKAGMIPLQMELGGKDACIVLEDADLDLAASSIAKGGFSYSGQRCTAVKLILAMESVANAIVEKVKAAVAELTVGPPEDDCDITPVVTESSANFIESLVMDAKEKGATSCQEYRREGNLIWPLLLDHVRPDMRIAWEEPFGPVLPIIRINSVEEAIHHCNASDFGLQGSVFTRDSNKAIMISDTMAAGTVQINSAPARGPDHFPFQGLEDSGIGSQGITNSINMMTKIKTTVINLPSPSYFMACRVPRITDRGKLDIARCAPGLREAANPVQFILWTGSSVDPPATQALIKTTKAFQ
ncbi:NADP-dependent glyceraldehyde-3-phosphate dehydrogenase [Apostasia shenzhenica]|uniref:NADP-dependent glyceraldehyde-3-phosphate dehydrogenase n=1 Tax=Apostasia shenzhenica TaxID=1088818 RepID=A0A2H9ZYC6_9ASPA|nr:NADP-dependent glyceraldehyde-3-phosphate dehydrogenase [Apostasia shenzhenica]